jgi:exopolysaccharide/PEP-CTERM locus tyrosine autokinase
MSGRSNEAMTDQSPKAPQTPPSVDGAPAARAKGKRPSLIERAGGSDAWRGLVVAKPAVPPLDVPVLTHRVAADGVPAAAEPDQTQVARLEPAPSPAQRFDALPAGQKFRGTFHAIDRRHLREQGLIEPEGPVTALLEEFRIIKRQLLFSAAEARAGNGPVNGDRILVASALPGEGKTFCSVNLALSMAAEKDTEVLLVDADFAKPSVLSTLGLPGGPGLLDALADPRVAVEDCILGTDIPGLFVLPAGNASGADTELLGSSRTAQVLDRLTANTRGRIVIFDSSPVLAASPASALALHVGLAVIVVRAGVTSEAALRDAIGLLSGCEDIRLLLNAAHFSPSGRRFGTYYGYKE